MILLTAILVALPFGFAVWWLEGRQKPVNRSFHVLYKRKIKAAQEKRDKQITKESYLLRVRNAELTAEIITVKDKINALDKEYTNCFSDMSKAVIRSSNKDFQIHQLEDKLGILQREHSMRVRGEWILG